MKKITDPKSEFIHYVAEGKCDRKNQPVVRSLLRLKADPKVVGADGRTALDRTVDADNKVITCFLRKAIRDPELSFLYKIDSEED